MSETPFVLDLDSNPHPRMLRHALSHRRHTDTDTGLAFWHGYLAAMCDATGCAESDLLLWLDRHEVDGQ